MQKNSQDEIIQKVDNNLASEINDSVNFERLQLWLGFIKFILGTFTIGIITTFINYHIQQKEIKLKEIEQQRAIELKEQEQLGNFIQHALQEDIGTRKRFAEYFSTVTRSKELRDRWSSYYEIVRDEYNQTKKELSALKEELGLEKLDEQRKVKIIAKVEQLEAKLEVPTTSGSSKYTLAIEKEREGFESLIEGQFEKAIISFETAEKIYPSFHQAYEIAKLLKNERLKLGNSEDYKNILRKIVDNYSWKAPKDLIDELRKISQ